MPHQIHEVGGVFAVMDRERRVEANFQRILSQKPRADRMKRAGPGEGVCHHTGLRSQHLGGDALDTALHLGSSAAREGQEHHAAWIDARYDEMRHAMRKRVGFAGAGARDDQQRWDVFEISAAVFDRAALVGIESGEIRRGRARAAGNAASTAFVFQNRLLVLHFPLLPNSRTVVQSMNIP